MRPTHLDLTDAGRLLRVTVVVPHTLPKPPPRFGGDGEYAGLSQIDVTRVQMLYFTLVTAVFVAMRVLTSYTIPEIPQGSRS